MKRTTVMLPPALENRAKVAARKRGVSFGELVRQAIQAELERERDPLADTGFVWKGAAPRDGSTNHDAYLYGKRQSRFVHKRA